MLDIVAEGAWIIVTAAAEPPHLAETIKVCKGIMPVPIEKRTLTVISLPTHSYRSVVTPVQSLVDERINPTGKLCFSSEHYVTMIWIIFKKKVSPSSKTARAYVLDVNVGLPEIDEVQLMQDAIKEIQSVIDLPLQIDTTDPIAMEKAMRIYNGKPLINSVNGKEQLCMECSSLVKKYGGVVIALTLDENGIPPTAEGRLEVARKIIATAETYGIPKTDLIFDVLCHDHQR
ncbi:MAG: dihydropteroate synthase [Eubacteriales bacterium]